MKRNGFTLVELLMATAIMTVVVVGALALYSRSNKISADQQQFLDLQNDVRAATYIIARELRMTGAGIPANLNSSREQYWSPQPPTRNASSAKPPPGASLPGA